MFAAASGFCVSVCDRLVGLGLAEVLMEGDPLERLVALEAGAGFFDDGLRDSPKLFEAGIAG